MQAAYDSLGERPISAAGRMLGGAAREPRGAPLRPCEIPDDDKQPLILNPQGRKLRVDLDGPALRVSSEGRAYRYFPLRRVSRVVVGPGVEFATEAMLACAAEGIVLVFRDTSGEVLARVVGRAGHRTELRQRVLDLLVLPDWPARYQAWLRHEEGRVASAVVRLLRAPRELKLDPERLRQWIDQTGVFFVGEEMAHESQQRFAEYGAAAMTAQLLQLGLGAQSERWFTAEFDLGADLSRLLALRAEPYRLQWLQRRHAWSVATGRQARPLGAEMPALIWERAEPELRAAGQALTHRLHAWLVSSA